MDGVWACCIVSLTNTSDSKLRPFGICADSLPIMRTLYIRILNLLWHGRPIRRVVAEESGAQAKGINLRSSFRRVDMRAGMTQFLIPGYAGSIIGSIRLHRCETSKI